MTALQQFVRESFRHDFAASMFFLISGLVATAFIGYLLLDFFKSASHSLQRRKKHRHPRGD